MANTASAKRAARKVARRTVINKSRRSRVRGFVRKVEEALAAGDKVRAAAAMKAAEPEIMRAAQKGVMHKNSATRRVSRLARRIATLGS
jgi:small subunit ribosomal protein S20